MAAGLITVAGTTGEVLVQYLDSGSTPRQVRAGIGTFYLEDDGSEYTWSTLYGDATASSGDISLVEVVNTFYVLDWEQSTNPNITENPPLTFDAVIVGSEVTSIDKAYYPYSPKIVGEHVNNANAEGIKAVGYKTVYPTNSADPVEHFLVIKVQGEDIPYLRITNEDDTHYIYLKGEESDGIPAGYTELPTCQIGEELL